MADWGKAINDQSNSDQNNSAGMASQAMENTGLYNKLVVGGMARGIIEPVTKASDQIVNDEYNQPAPQNLGDVLHSGNEAGASYLKNTAGNPSLWWDAANLALTKGTKGGTTIPGSVADASKIVTGKGLWEGIVDAAKNPITWDKVVSSARANSKNQVQAVKDEIEKLLESENPFKPSTSEIKLNATSGPPNVPETPPEPLVQGAQSPLTTKAQMINDTPITSDGLPRGNPDYNISRPQTSGATGPMSKPTTLSDQLPPMSQGSATPYPGIDAVEKRAALGEQIPKNFWTGRSNADTAQSQAYAYVRDALSNELKSANEGLSAADRAYARHKNLPSMLAKAGIGTTGTIGTVAGLGALASHLLGSSSENSQ